MSKILDNFTKKLDKLENYFILNEEKDYFVMGTPVTLKIHRTITGNIFQLFSENIDKEFPIFFILAFGDNFSKFKEYRKKQFPMLILPNSLKNAKTEIIQQELDNFVDVKFRA